MKTLKARFYDERYQENYFTYFGYGLSCGSKSDLIPNVPLCFYSFHIMVILGFYFFIFLFTLMLIFSLRNNLQKRRSGFSELLFLPFHSHTSPPRPDG